MVGFWLRRLVCCGSCLLHIQALCGLRGGEVMELVAKDRCGFCWQLLADGMTPFVIRKMDRVFVASCGLEVVNAEV